MIYEEVDVRICIRHRFWLVDSHHLHPHLYADDTQIYRFSDPSGASRLQLRVLACVDDVSMWMHSNRLQLNLAKLSTMAVLES